MKIYDLLEARKNPEHPSQKKHYDPFTAYRDKDVSDLYVSFTNVDKIGVNPLSNYNTPIGVYTYPMKYVLNMVSTTALPFAGHRPIIYVIKPTEPVLKLSEYTEDAFLTDLKKVRTYAIKVLNISVEKVDFTIKEAIGDARYSDNQFASKIWNVVRMLADAAPNTASRVGRIADNRKLGDGTIRFNTILRRALGYNIIVDDKHYGIIHPNEKTQAVFLSKSSFTVVDKIRNTQKEHDILEYEARVITDNGTDTKNKKILDFIFSDPLRYGIEYVANRGRGRNSKIEEAIRTSQNPTMALKYARLCLLPLNIRLKEVEEVIAKSPYQSIDYARSIHGRFEAGEDNIIKSSSFDCLMYAQLLVEFKKPVPEKILNGITDIDHAYRFVVQTGMRLPQLENRLKNEDPRYVSMYAAISDEHAEAVKKLGL